MTFDSGRRNAAPFLKCIITAARTTRTNAVRLRVAQVVARSNLDKSILNLHPHDLRVLCAPFYVYPMCCPLLSLSIPLQPFLFLSFPKPQERITRERDQEAVAMRRALLITAASTVATTSTVAFNVNLYVKTASVGAISGSSSPFLAASGPRRSTRTRTRTAGSLYNSRNGGVEGLYQWTGKQGGRRRSLARREGVSMQASSEASVDTPDVETEENVNKDRVWNKCTDRVELGTSGLMVSRVS